MGVGTVTVVIVGAAATAAADESSSAFSSSMRGTAGASDERSLRIFLLMESQQLVMKPPGPVYDCTRRQQHRSLDPRENQLTLPKLVHLKKKKKHIQHLYEGRRDRISLRFWESVTLSTDSCESSLSATVEIWKHNNNNQLRRTYKTSSLKQHLSSGLSGTNAAVGLCASPARPGPVGTG